MTLKTRDRNWKARLHPTVSNAEWTLRVELVKRGVQVQIQYPIVLDQTTCDLFIVDTSGKTRGTAIFLDGPPHLKSKVETRDLWVDKCLERQNFKCLRFPYKSPLTQKQLAEILAKIGETVKFDEVEK